MMFGIWDPRFKIQDPKKSSWIGILDPWGKKHQIPDQGFATLVKSKFVFIKLALS
jgi:hypothetical protein